MASLGKRVYSFQLSNFIPQFAKFNYFMGFFVIARVSPLDLQFIRFTIESFGKAASSLRWFYAGSEAFSLVAVVAVDSESEELFSLMPPKNLG